MNMVRFLIRRIITGILVLWLVATGTFFLFFAAVPVQVVARNLAGRAATPAVLAQVTKYYGLDRPLFAQYLTFLHKLIKGNLGQSFLTQQAVTTIIKQDLPVTASVVIGGVLLWLIAGLAVGILSATRARSLFDRVATRRRAGRSVRAYLRGRRTAHHLRVRAAQPARHQLHPDRLCPALPGRSCRGWAR